MDELTVRHFLVCGHVEYDPHTPLAPYTVRNVVFRHRPADGAGYPVKIPDLWVFALLVGTGDYEFWVEVVRRPPVGPDEGDEDETEPEFVAAYGPFVTRFGSEMTTLPRGWHLRAVPFDRPGAYDFRLLHEGVVLAEELVQLEE